MVETRWDDIRRRLNEGNCWPSGSVFELLDELEAEAKSLRDDAALGKLVRQMPELAEPGHVLVKLIHSTWWKANRWLVDWSGPTCVGGTPEAALREALETSRVREKGDE